MTEGAPNPFCHRCNVLIDESITCAHMMFQGTTFVLCESCAYAAVGDDEDTANYLVAQGEQFFNRSFDSYNAAADWVDGMCAYWNTDRTKYRVLRAVTAPVVLFDDAEGA